MQQAKRASYLATGEDERRGDDLRVFDKCVFHLVGERRAAERSQRQGTREGRREAVREGVKPGRRRTAQWKRGVGKVTQLSANACLIQEDLVLSSRTRGVVLFPDGAT